MLQTLFVRKSVADIARDTAETQHEFRRSLSAMNLMALGIGEIIGAGIFVLTGQAAAQYAGPAIILSFLLSGAACACAALCYAEMAAMIPLSGSAYTYAYATLGEFCAWIIGWDLTLEYLFGASAVAVGWSGYVVSFFQDFGITIPQVISDAPLKYSPDSGWGITGALINFPAVVVTVLTTALLVVGIRESARMNNIIVLVKVAVILLFIGFGCSYISATNLTPFIPPNTGVFGHYGWSGILRGAGVIFFAYIGFDAVSTTAQEAKNPQRDMPIGIIGSFVVSTLLYILVALVITGIVRYDQLGVPDPIAVALNAAGPGLFWLRPLIKLGAIAGLTSVVLVSILGQPRIMYSMSRDGLLPAWVSKMHPRFRTPHLTTMLTGAVALVFAGLFPIDILGELVSIGTLMAFAIVCVGVLVLRYIHPEMHRPFRTPWSPFIPVLGAVAAVVQMAALPFDTWLRLVVWLIIGLAIYFGYSVRHSRLRAQVRS